MKKTKRKDLPNKSRKVTLRFTADEYSNIKDCSKQAQLTVSEYIRRCVTNREIPDYHTIIHDETEILKELHNINKVGSNLNQIAHYFNSNGLLNTDIAKELKEIIQHLNDSCIRFDAAVEKEYGNSKTH